MFRRASVIAAIISLAVSCAPFTEAPTIPELPTERVPAPPSSTITLIYQPGHYDWDGATYRYQAGVWVPRGNRRLWLDGYWRRSGPNWVWEPAHWI